MRRSKLPRDSFTDCANAKDATGSFGLKDTRNHNYRGEGNEN